MKVFEHKKGMPSSKKRILYIHHGKGIGGASVSLTLMIKMLDREKFEPKLLCFRNKDLLKLFDECDLEISFIKIASIFPHTTGMWYPWFKIVPLFIAVIKYPLSIIEYYYWIKRIKPDIVHLNSSSLTSAAIAAWLRSVKVVWHIREFVVDGYFGLRLWWHKFVGKKVVDRIIAISRYDADRIGHMDNTTVVHNFVDFKYFNKDIKKRQKHEDCLKVCMLGGVSEIKGTIEFIRSYSIVKKRVSNVKFYIAGSDRISGYNQNALSSIKIWIKKHFGYVAKVYKLCQADNGSEIVFTGVITNIPEFLGEIDILVFPSTMPHFPRPIIEAWAMEIPVIASDFGEIIEIVEHGRDGLIVPAGDVESLANAIIKLLSDNKILRSLGAAGYQKACTLFEAEANMKQITEIYSKLTNS